MQIEHEMSKDSKECRLIRSPSWPFLIWNIWVRLLADLKIILIFAWGRVVYVLLILIAYLEVSLYGTKHW